MDGYYRVSIYGDKEIMFWSNSLQKWCDTEGERHPDSDIEIRDNNPIEV